MKKLMVLMMALAMTVSLAACGGGKTSETTQPPTQASTAAPTQPSTAAPAETEAETSAEEELTFELDYETIAGWVYGGYLGETDDGAPALLAVNEDTTVAIAVFGDNDTMEAVSFVGEITDNGDDTVTIADPESELTFTFGFYETEEGTYIMDMGEEIGTATMVPTEYEALMEALKNAIENYKHVA